jgi:hypothetical protein
MRISLNASIEDLSIVFVGEMNQEKPKFRIKYFDHYTLYADLSNCIVVHVNRH